MLYDDDELAELVDDAVSTIELIAVETPETTIYCLDEERARDEVLACALRNELAFTRTEEVAADYLWVEDDGWIVVVQEREVA